MILRVDGPSAQTSAIALELDTPRAGRGRMLHKYRETPGRTETRHGTAD